MRAAFRRLLLNETLRHVKTRASRDISVAIENGAFPLNAVQGNRTHLIVSSDHY